MELEWSEIQTSPIDWIVHASSNLLVQTWVGDATGTLNIESLIVGDHLGENIQHSLLRNMWLADVASRGHVKSYSQLGKRTHHGSP